MTQRTDTPQKRLWNAVILLAAQDAKAGGALSREELSEWVNSHDFEWVCENADQDVLSTRQGLIDLLTTHSDKTKPKIKPERIALGSGLQAHGFERSATRTRKRGLVGDKSGKKVV